MDVAASAAVWFMLMAAPVPSTGVVATSPRRKKAICPLANELAGATVPAALAEVLGAALAGADAEAEAEAEAEPEPEAEAEGLALADAVGKPRCREPNADCRIDALCEPPDTAMTTPRVMPNATGMARGTAIRAARLRRVRRRIAGRCPVSIQSTSVST
jgi:hypothetical protein